MTDTTTAFYLPQPDPTARPEDVVRVVAYYAARAGAEPTNADYARGGYWAAVGRTSDARVMAGHSPVGQTASWHPAGHPGPGRDHSLRDFPRLLHLVRRDQRLVLLLVRVGHRVGRRQRRADHRRDQPMTTVTP